jgi:hypothetical protein
LHIEQHYVFKHILTYISKTQILTKRNKIKTQEMDLIFFKRTVGQTRKDGIQNQILRGVKYKV